MPLDTSIVGAVSGTGADVDSNRQLKVNLPKLETDAGYVALLGERDAGDVTGTARRLAFEPSEDYRMRAELDTLLDSEVFNYVAQNTAKHILRTTTMTGTYSEGAFNTNGSGITTASTGLLLQTYQYFQLFGASQVFLDFSGGIS